jgi:hypothetical protein
VDTLKMTIELPPHRVKRLFEILDSVPPHQGRTSVKKRQKLLGELRSMVLAVPGGNGMFSILQSVLSKRCDSTSRLRLTKPVHAILKDFRLLAQDLATRPTRLAVLVPADRPSTLGAHDAAASGMGGIHFFPMGDGSVDPILWRSRFPPLLPPGWSRPTTQLETLPIASSSWREVWRSWMSCHSNMTYGKRPCTTRLTMLLRSGGNEKGPCPQRAPPLACSDSRPCTSGTFDTSHCMITSLAGPTPCQMTAVGYGP